MKTIVDYATKVKEQHALNKTLAPVETDLTDASRDYAIGEQFIYDGDLFKAKTAIAEHDALVLNTNYEAADDITTQIKNKTVTTDPVPTEGSTNPVQSNGVFVENRNIYAVNGKMGAKALLPISLADIKAKNTTGTWNDNAYAINGVTFTVNTDSDGFITDIAATGTASADATLMVYGYSYTSSYAVTYDTPVIASIDFVGSDSTARGIVWGTNSSYIEATEVQIPAGTIYGFGLRVLNGYEIPVGGITFKPMIRFASDSDDTYQPYVKTNKELTAENEALTNKLNNEIVTRSALGAKNYAKNDNYTRTVSDVTFTKNDDGSISLSGTASGNIYYVFDGTVVSTTSAMNGHLELPQGEYIFSTDGSTDNAYGTTSIISAFLYNVNGSSTFVQSSDTKANRTFAVTTTDKIVVGLYIKNGTDTTGYRFYPMIRLASDTDATYQPYAKTNQELTAENQTLTNYANAQTNPNLLDNPWFTVNQRGISGAVSTAYGFDRWWGIYDYDSTNKCLKFSAVSQYVLQNFESDFKEKLDGKTVTLSVLYADGTIEKGTDVYHAVNSTYVFFFSGRVLCQISPDGFFALTANEVCSIKACKMELGSVSTLASDTAPNYATELLKCQRYYITSGTSGTSAYGFTASTTKGYIYIPVAVKMRANPTPESLSGHIYFNGNDITITSYQVVGAKVNSVQVEINVASGLQASNTLVVSNLLFALSADL